MTRPGVTVQCKMAIKEKASLLPTSFAAVKDTGVNNGGYFATRSVFGWLHIVATTLMFCWLVILTLRGSHPESQHVVLPKVLVHELINSEEVGSCNFGSP